MNLQKSIDQLNNWTQNGNYIERTITFPDFKETISRMVQIAFVCEAINHHPEWSNVYNKLEIRLSTHDAGTITLKDIDLAKAIDKIVDQS